MIGRLPDIATELEGLYGTRERSNAELGLAETQSTDSKIGRLISEREELESILAACEVVMLSSSIDAVHIGTLVRLVGNVKKRRAVRNIYIGGHHDGLIEWANLPKKPAHVVVSYDDRIGRRLCGKTVGETVTVNCGDFPGVWEIDDISIPQFLRTIRGSKKVA